MKNLVVNTLIILMVFDDWGSLAETRSRLASEGIVQNPALKLIIRTRKVIETQKILALQARGPAGHKLEYLALPIGEIVVVWVDMLSLFPGGCVAVLHRLCKAADASRGAGRYCEATRYEYDDNNHIYNNNIICIFPHGIFSTCACWNLGPAYLDCRHHVVAVVVTFVDGLTRKKRRARRGARKPKFSGAAVQP